jgi:holo-[acyl-carrier protein] synthase
MLLGLGIDIASIERIRASLERFGDRFWERILTENERIDLSARADRATALAGRFAAKEAAAKALGGPPDVLWHTIEVRSGAGGAPRLYTLIAWECAVFCSRLHTTRVSPQPSSRSTANSAPNLEYATGHDPGAVTG